MIVKFSLMPSVEVCSKPKSHFTWQLTINIFNTYSDKSPPNGLLRSAHCCPMTENSDSD